MPTDDLVRLVRSIQQSQTAAYAHFSKQFNELNTELSDIDRRLARLARNLPDKNSEAEFAHGALITTGRPLADDTHEAALLCAQGEHFRAITDRTRHHGQRRDRGGRCSREAGGPACLIQRRHDTDE